MRYDLHIHTHYSRCSNLKPEIILKTAKKLKLNGIAITDHNKFEGALKTFKLNKDKNFEVIKGEEIETPEAHVLGLYLSSYIKPGPILEVLDKIKKQDGIAIIAHPFSLFRKGLSIDINKIKNMINAIETFNSRMVFSWENKKALKVAEKYSIPKTGGSDTHFWFEVGKAYTVFEGDLRKALKKNKTKANGSIKLSFIGSFLSGVYKHLI